MLKTFGTLIYVFYICLEFRYSNLEFNSPIPFYPVKSLRNGYPLYPSQRKMRFILGCPRKRIPKRSNISRSWSAPGTNWSSMKITTASISPCAGGCSWLRNGSGNEPTSANIRAGATRSEFCYPWPSSCWCSHFVSPGC